MSRTAIIVGATGLTGQELLQLLLEDETYTRVIHYGRSSAGVKHPKFEERFVNLFMIKEEKEDFYADVVFCCIGTTTAKTPDYEQYKKIDKGIPLDLADLCEANQLPKLMIMSSMGAHPESAIDYSRIKGEMEEEVAQRDISEIYFIEPSIIGGRREETRLGESIGKFFMTLVDPVMFGPLKRFRIIDPDQIAKAMIQLDKKGYWQSRIESNILLQLSDDFDDNKKMTEENKAYSHSE